MGVNKIEENEEDKDDDTYELYDTISKFSLDEYTYNPPTIVHKSKYYKANNPTVSLCVFVTTRVSCGGNHPTNTES